AGQLAFGLTDTDDALGEIDAGMPVEIVYPDQADGELGTLFIPNTLSVIKGCPHPEAAHQLIDFLLSPDIETKLAEGASAQIPLNPKTHAKIEISHPKTGRPDGGVFPPRRERGAPRQKFPSRKIQRCGVERAWKKPHGASTKKKLQRPPIALARL